MTKDQAVEQGYAEQVAAVEEVAPDFSQRVCEDPTVIEFTAHHEFADADGVINRIMTAFYYQDKEDIDALPDGDLGSLDWQVSEYEVS